MALTAHPSRDFTNTHLKGPVSLPWQMKIKVYDCLFLNRHSIILVGAYLWCLSQNVLPSAGNKLASSLAYLPGSVGNKQGGQAGLGASVFVMEEDGGCAAAAQSLPAT